jgi:hypothetical protein
VQSVGKKLAAIKEMSENILSSPDEFEVVFMNGDMAAWSGSDVFDKFVYISDVLSVTLGVSDSLSKLLKFCLILTSRMEVIIPPKVHEIQRFRCVQEIQLRCDRLQKILGTGFVSQHIFIRSCIRTDMEKILPK